MSNATVTDVEHPTLMLESSRSNSTAPDVSTKRGPYVSLKEPSSHQRHLRAQLEGHDLWRFMSLPWRLRYGSIVTLETDPFWSHDTHIQFWLKVVGGFLMLDELAKRTLLNLKARRFKITDPSFARRKG
ncbi:hypothetical protein BYT27DRAFT_7212409 [Phlegmacium glaucopus]|nr:hypothetical protein BYT27DRAFT_7212409 [Phlegmacium glaucopus]